MQWQSASATDASRFPTPQCAYPSGASAASRSLVFTSRLWKMGRLDIQRTGLAGCLQFCTSVEAGDAFQARILDLRSPVRTMHAANAGVEILEDRVRCEDRHSQVSP